MKIKPGAIKILKSRKEKNKALHGVGKDTRAQDPREHQLLNGVEGTSSKCSVTIKRHPGDSESLCPLSHTLSTCVLVLMNV